MKFFTLILFVILRLVKNPGAISRNLHRPILLLLALLFPAMTAVNVHAQLVERDFGERAVFKERGNIEMIGNVLLTCAPGGTPDCADVQDGTEPSNNSRSLEFVNIDTGAGLSNSSSADLNLPAGATVLYAGLYWGARAADDDDTRSSLQFRVADSGTYESIDADEMDIVSTAGGNLTRPYLASADVTDLVRDAGNGTYYAGDLTAENPSNPGNLGFYGGWSLIVIYQDDTQPLRYLGLFDGAVHVINGSYDITISGFRTPASGSFNTFTGGLVWEGDQGGDFSSGDQFLLNNDPITNDLNPSDNFWNSSITRLDNRISAKDPDYVNQLGLDIDYMDVSGILDNGAEEATLSFFSGIEPDDDTYYSHALTFAVDLEVVDLSVELNGGPCWRMLSSPVEGLTYAEMLEGLWTQGTAGAEYDGGDPNVLLWPNGQAGNDPNGWQPVADLNTVIPPGTGFLVGVYADDNYDGTPDSFPKTLSVSGTPHTGDITPPMNTTDGGWTLVGNPYTQSVNFSALPKIDLIDAGYVYDRNYGGAGGPTNGNTGGWRSTSDDYGDVINGAFAPGQGFFVQNTTPADSPSITFTEASRTGDDGEFYGKQGKDTKKRTDYFRLEVNGQSLTNSTWIRFSEEGSVEPVYGDAVELQPLSEQYVLFGSRKADGTLSDIGHFPLPTGELDIPVYVEATQPGTYSITATELDLPTGVELYLHDLDTGESVPVTSSLDYSFTIGQHAKSTPEAEGITPCPASPRKAKSTGSDRFLITTSQDGTAGELPDEVALGQNYPNPFNPSTQITYELPQASEVRLEVFDMAGRLVATLVDGQAAAGTHQVNFNAGNLSSGTYLYRLTARGANGSNKIFTKKLTLIK